jgi:methionyl-tRNA formyltransferase
MQRECPIGEHENVGSLYDRLMGIGAKLVIETVEGLVKGELTPMPQSGRITGAPKLNKEIARIKWDMTDAEQPGTSTATLIDRLVRGLSPYPAAITAMTDGQKQYEFKVFECSIAANANPASTATAGTIKSDGKSYVHVYCADGSAVSLDEIQMAGKKRMKVKDFLLGFRNIEQYKFI